MAKNQVSIAINAQDNASTPLKRVTQTLNQATAEVKKATDPLKKLQNSFTNFSLAVPGIKLVADSLGTVRQKVSECVTAFAEIEKTTKQLQFAQNVNLQLKAAGKDLTQFSADMAKTFKNVFSQGEIQAAISELSFDHTYEEIEKITKVSGDLASATGMTLSQAVESLANTMNGRLSTELKRITPELAALDSEALKSGQAIDILGEKLAGLADEMSGTTGASIKAFNETVGDLKESFGELFSDALTPMRNYFTEVISNLNTVISQHIKVRKLAKGENLSSAEALSTRNYNIGKLAVDANGNFPSWWNDEIANELMYRYKEYGKGNKSAFIKSNMTLAGGNESIADEIGLASRRFIDAMNGLIGSNKAFFKNTTDAVRNADDEWIAALKEEDRVRKEAEAALEQYGIAVVEQATESATDAITNSITFGRNAIMGMNLRNAVNSKSLISLPDVLGKGYAPSNYIEPTNGYSLGFGDIGSDITAFDFVEQVVMCTDSFSLLNQAINPLQTMLTESIATLDPVVTDILQPIVNALKILGNLYSQTILPKLELLVPVVDALGKVFIWLYNHVFKWIGNAMITVWNEVYNAMAWVANGLISLYNKIPGVTQKAGLSYNAYNSGWLENLSEDALANYGSTSSGTAGGASAYQAARDITVNVIYNNSYVNGDARAIAISIRDEIRNAETLGY